MAVPMTWLANIDLGEASVRYPVLKFCMRSEAVPTAHHDAAGRKACNHTAMVGACPSSKHEYGKLAVGGGRIPVGEAAAVGVAESQQWGEDMDDQDMVPLERRKDARKCNNGEGGDYNVASIYCPRRFIIRDGKAFEHGRNEGGCGSTYDLDEVVEAIS
ncbi:hypothetical protein MUK42_23217 [Musa troglodytarum]|uniref:Uncharacterized protein n=1 Tax=Musa troglodytarum TaxID=320322 RepID=A0A9E7JG91_9LILI|nr:hypothetical protein MUK42_23217 [Musa troglodytarum]